MFDEFVEHEVGSELLDFGDVVEETENLGFDRQLFGASLKDLKESKVVSQRQMSRGLFWNFYPALGKVQQLGRLSINEACSS